VERSRAVFVKLPQGVRVLGFDIQTGTVPQFGIYEHLVEGRSLAVAVLEFASWRVERRMGG